MTTITEDESTRAMHLIDWLKVLSEGVIKPHKKQEGDDSCCNTNYFIRDSNGFKEDIVAINKELTKILIK